MSNQPKVKAKFAVEIEVATVDGTVSEQQLAEMAAAELLAMAGYSHILCQTENERAVYMTKVTLVSQ